MSRSNDVPVLPYGTPREWSDAAARLESHLAGDGLVAYPTETVYGLGCAIRPGALRRLAAVKGHRPFLVLIPDREATEGLVWGSAARELAERFWPGPLTLALPARPRGFPPEVVGPDGTVAVRISPHGAVSALLEAVGGPVTSTSANLPGAPATRSAEAVVAALGGVPDLLVLDGGTLPEAPPSTIVRCRAGRVRILREGGIDRETIAAAVEVE